MKLPESKLPWEIRLCNSNWNEYSVFDSRGDYVSDNTAYENIAPNTKDAEYIVQAANNFPEAVRLLKLVSALFEDVYTYNSEVPDKVNQFLTKLEEDEKDSK